MPDKRCENGHFIDASWDLCPYCPAPSVERMSIVRPSSPSSPAVSAVPAVPSVNDTPPRPRTRASGEVPLPPFSSVPQSSPFSREPDFGTQAPAPPTQRTIAVPRPDHRVNSPHAEPPRYVVGWLIAINGSAHGESFPIRVGRNVIGRDRRSDVVIVDDQASAHHADLVFRPEERRFILMDHNSTNGTFVNDQEIEPRRDLLSRDIVRVGTQSYLFFPLCDMNFGWDDQGRLK